MILEEWNLEAMDLCYVPTMKWLRTEVFRPWELEKIHSFFGGGGGRGVERGINSKMENRLSWTFLWRLGYHFIGKPILYFLPTPILPPSSTSEFRFCKHEWVKKTTLGVVGKGGYICKICIFQLVSHRSRENKRYDSVACPVYKSANAEDYQP